MKRLAVSLLGLVGAVLLCAAWTEFRWRGQRSKELIS